MIGAVLIPGALAPKLVTREMIAGMNEGAVIVDVAIDQGGCFETSHATTHSDPVFVVDGRHALLRREHARRRADHLDEGADERDAPVRRGDRGSRARRGRGRATTRSRRASTSSTGKITYEAVAEAHGLDVHAARRRALARRLQARPPRVATGPPAARGLLLLLGARTGLTFTTSQVTAAARPITAAMKATKPTSPRALATRLG